MWWTLGPQIPSTSVLAHLRFFWTFGGLKTAISPGGGGFGRYLRTPPFLLLPVRLGHCNRLLHRLLGGIAPHQNAGQDFISAIRWHLRSELLFCQCTVAATQKRRERCPAVLHQSESMTPCPPRGTCCRKRHLSAHLNSAFTPHRLLPLGEQH